MLTALTKLITPRLLGRWFRISVLLGCLALSGCQQADVRGGNDKLADDELSRMTRQLRPRDPDTEPAGLSAKARKIDADFGIR